MLPAVPPPRVWAKSPLSVPERKRLSLIFKVMSAALELVVVLV